MEKRRAMLRVSYAALIICGLFIVYGAIYSELILGMSLTAAVLAGIFVIACHLRMNRYQKLFSGSHFAIWEYSRAETEHKSPVSLPHCANKCAPPLFRFRLVFFS